jgi:hypothetical protein
MQEVSEPMDAVPSRALAAHSFDAELLLLARSKMTHLSLQAALRRTLAFDVPLPGVASIDFVQGGDDAWVAARDHDLRAMLKLLLGHAIRECPLVRRLEVVVKPEHPGATLVVRDVVPQSTADSEPPVVEMDMRPLRPDAHLLQPELALLQVCARRIGARILVADRHRPRPKWPLARCVYMTAQFPPPFNVVVNCN